MGKSEKICPIEVVKRTNILIKNFNLDNFEVSQEVVKFINWGLSQKILSFDYLLNVITQTIKHFNNRKKLIRLDDLFITDREGLIARLRFSVLNSEMLIINDEQNTGEFKQVPKTEHVH